jgi:hypothetical protein
MLKNGYKLTIYSRGREYESFTFGSLGKALEYGEKVTLGTSFIYGIKQTKFESRKPTEQAYWLNELGSSL